MVELCPGKPYPSRHYFPAPRAFHDNHSTIWDSIFSPGQWENFKGQLRAWQGIRQQGLDHDGKTAKTIIRRYQKSRARLKRVVTLNKGVTKQHHHIETASRRASGVFNNLQKVLSYAKPDGFFEHCGRDTGRDLDCFDDNFILIAEENSLISLLRRR